MARQNLIGTLTGRSRPLKVRQSDGICRISDGQDSLYLASPWRENRYRKGIAKQLDALAWVYGYGQVYDVTADDVVIDIGANVGEFSRFCAGRGAEVYSIEADRTNFWPLVLNARASKRIRPFNMAIWNENTTLEFFSAVDSANSSAIRPELCKDTFRQVAITLDCFTSVFGISDIHLIKCDAEGAEPEVLRGAKETLKRTRFVAFDCGFERGNESTYDDCAQILRECGFEIIKLDGSIRQSETLFGKNKALV